MKEKPKQSRFQPRQIQKRLVGEESRNTKQDATKFFFSWVFDFRKVTTMQIITRLERDMQMQIQENTTYLCD